MKYSAWFAGAIVVLGTVVLLSQPSCADYYKREGGQAFHVRQDCPALQGYKVVSIVSKNGLMPCRVCDAKEFDARQNPKLSFSRMDPSAKPPKTIQEMSGTAYEYEESAKKPAVSRSVKYPPNWEDNNKLHGDRSGVFYVENGQKVYINGQPHNAGGTGVVWHP